MRDNILKCHKSYFSNILNEVEYKNWEFYVGKDETRCYLQVQFKDSCNDTGKVNLQKGRKWFLSPHMTKSEVVSTALKAVLTAEEHEAREKFLYKKARIFGPHLDVDFLANLALITDERS